MNSHMYCLVPLWPKLDTWPKLASMTFCPWHFNIESCDPRTKKQLELFYPASDQPLQDSPCPSLLLGLRLLSLFLHGPSLLQWNCLPLCVTGYQWPVLGGCSRLLGTKNHSVVLSNSWVAQRSQRVGHDWGTEWQHAAPMSGWGALWCSLRPISLGLSNRSSYSVFLLPFWMQLMNADPLGNFLVVQWLGGLPWCGSTVKNPPVYKRHRRHGFNPWVGKIPWRRAWQHAPVFLPGKSHGQRSLAGCTPWGRKESDMTKATEHALTQ